MIMNEETKNQPVAASPSESLSSILQTAQAQTSQPTTMATNAPAPLATPPGEIILPESHKKGISKKDLFLIGFLLIALLGGYLYTANNLKLFPFKKIVAVDAIVSPAGLVNQDIGISKTADIAKAAKSGNGEVLSITTKAEKFSLELPQGWASFQDTTLLASYLANVEYIIDATSPKAYTNTGFDKDGKLDTWNRRVIYVDNYGENTSGNSLTRRDSMAETFQLLTSKSNDGWTYQKLQIAGINAFVRKKDLTTEKRTVSISEYYIVSNKNIYVVGEAIWNDEKVKQASTFTDILKTLGTLSIVANAN
jgi:hypothetical protein